MPVTINRSSVLVNKSNVFVNPYPNENIVLYSEEPNNGSGNGNWNGINYGWQGGDLFSNSSFTITNNQGFDLIGKNTLAKIDLTLFSNGFYFDIPTVSGTTYYMSMDVKRGTSTDIRYEIYDLEHFVYIISSTSYYSMTSSTVQRLQFAFTATGNITRFVPSAAVYPTYTYTGTFYFGRFQVSTKPNSVYIKTRSLSILK